MRVRVLAFSLAFACVTSSALALPRASAASPAAAEPMPASRLLGLRLGLLALGGLAIAAVFYASRASRRAAGVRAAVLDAQFDLQAESRRSASLDDLRARDPGLTEASIEARVRRVGAILDEAARSGDVRAARRFLSDGCLARFQVSLALRNSDGVRRVRTDEKTLYVTLEAVQVREPLDVVHVRVTTEAREATVPREATPERVDAALGTSPLTPRTEIRTLVRHRGAKTRELADAAPVACPACGASFDDGDVGAFRCGQCKALACSGEHDWVVTRITDLAEWHPNAAAEVAGLARLREADAGVTREGLEDRATYLFWKWLECCRTDSLLPLSKAATATLAERGGDRGTTAVAARDVEVSGVDVDVCDGATDASDADHVYVNVFWSARGATDDSATRPFPRRSTLRLARTRGLTTKPSMSFAACPSCGDLLRETDGPLCDSCGAAVVASGQVWALDAVLEPGAARPRGSERPGPALGFLVPDVRDPRERVVLFSQMARALSTGGLTRDDKRLLAQCGKRWGVEDELVARAVAGELTGEEPPAASAAWFLAGLVGAALVDGTIDAEELAALKRTCARLKLAPEILDRQIAATKAHATAVS